MLAAPATTEQSAVASERAGALPLVQFGCPPSRVWDSKSNETRVHPDQIRLIGSGCRSLSRLAHHSTPRACLYSRRWSSSSVNASGTLHAGTSPSYQAKLT